MAPHESDSDVVVQYTQESYEETVTQICEPRPPRGKEEDKELEDFIDSKMETASKSLKLAAAAFAIGGMACPPAAVVSAALGLAAVLVSYLDSQNKMKNLLGKITDHIHKVRKQMNSGFDDLEELITKNDFLSEVVCPSIELYDAFIRYVKDPNEANKREFIDCCVTAIAKIDRYTDANFIKKSQIPRHFVHKEYVAAVMYLFKTLLDVTIAHTFYYTMMSKSERDKQMKADGLVTLMKEVEIKLQGVCEWRKESYFTRENLDPIIRRGSLVEKQLPEKRVVIYGQLSTLFSNEFNEKYVAVVWTHHKSKLYDEHFSAPSEDHTLMFTGLKNKDGKKKSIVLHRIKKESTENVDRNARKNLGTDVVNKLRKRKIEKAWTRIPVAKDGFSLVLYWGVAWVAAHEHQQWDCKYFHSDGAGNDYFADEVAVSGNVATNKRHYCIFFKY